MKSRMNRITPPRPYLVSAWRGWPRGVGNVCTAQYILGVLAINHVLSFMFFFVCRWATMWPLSIIVRSWTEPGHLATTSVTWPVCLQTSCTFTQKYSFLFRWRAVMLADNQSKCSMNKTTPLRRYSYETDHVPVVLSTQQNHGLFVTSMDYSYHLWHGLFIPWTVRTIDGLFTPSLDYLYSGLFVLLMDYSYHRWTTRTTDYYYYW